MDAIAWLEDRVGFREFPAKDRKAISDFALLWSLFEGTMLETEACIPDIKALVGRLSEQGSLRPEELAPTLAYFRDRYFQDGRFTEHFPDLWRNNKVDDTVSRVISGAENGALEGVQAVLVIIYRLRNNLFHGVKWGYRMKGQRGNFEHANDALMAIMAMDGPQERRPD